MALIRSKSRVASAAITNTTTHTVLSTARPGGLPIIPALSLCPPTRKDKRRERRSDTLVVVIIDRTPETTHTHTHTNIHAHTCTEYMSKHTDK